MRTLALVPTILLSILLANCSFNRWYKTEDFLKGLKCGQSPEEVRAYAVEFKPKLKIGERLVVDRIAFEFDGPQLQLLSVSHPDTKFVMGFRSNELLTVQFGWQSGIMNASASMRKNLCTDELSSAVYIDNQLDGPSTVLVDGKEAERDKYWLPEGQHIIAVRLASGEEIKKTVDIGAGSKSGHINLIFREKVDQSTTPPSQEPG